MTGAVPLVDPADAPRGARADASVRGVLPRQRSLEVVRSFRPDIEGLRALAVLVVVVYHAGVPFVSGGFVGVDVFFVISGFLITSHLFSQLIGGTFSLVGFYARRIRRLLPLSVLVLTVTTVAFTVLLPPLVTRDWWTDAKWAALFSLNLRLARSGVDYQANPEPSPLQHFWSLGVEEQFYLCWPLALLVVALVWRATGRRGSLRRWSFAIMAVFSVCSFTASVWLLDRAQPYAYFLSPARAWELSAGGLLALATPWIARHGGRFLREVLVVAGLLLVLAAALVFDDTTLFPGTAALLPVTGTLLVIAAGAGHGSRAERLLLDRPAVQWIGRQSYGWYLWHWPALVLVPLVVRGTGTWPAGLAVAAGTLGLSAVTQRLVENPVRRSPRLQRRSRAVVLGAVLTCCALVVPTSAVALAGPTVGPGPAAAAPELRASGLDAVLRSGLAVAAVPGNLTPALDVAALDEPESSPVDGLSCMVASLHQTTLSKDPGASCVYGDPDGAVTVALTGDSHAEQWLPTLDQLGRERNWRVVNLTKSSCPLYDLRVVNAKLGREFFECYTWRAAALERLRAERPQLVVTSAIVFSDAGGSVQDEVLSWSTGVAATVGELSTFSPRTVVLGDTPWPGYDVPRCLAQNLEDSSVCAADVESAVQEPLRRSAVEAASMASGADYVDTVGWLCVEGRCPAVLGDTLVFRDQSHLSATMARRMAPLMGEALRVGP